MKEKIREELERDFINWFWNKTKDPNCNCEWCKHMNSYLMPKISLEDISQFIVEDLKD